VIIDHVCVCLEFGVGAMDRGCERRMSGFDGRGVSAGISVSDDIVIELGSFIV
jgi:hypothetical protein